MIKMMLTEKCFSESEVGWWEFQLITCVTRTVLCPNQFQISNWIFEIHHVKNVTILYLSAVARLNLHFALHRYNFPPINHRKIKPGRECHCGVQLHLKTWTKSSNRWKVQLMWRRRIGLTPLHVACMAENVPVVRLLLNGGANVEARNNAAATPLQITSDDGGLQAVEMLLRQGADISAKDNNGMTSPHSASKNDHLEVV